MPQVSGNIGLSPSLVAFAFLIIIGITAAAVYLILGKSKVTINKTWGCGYYSSDSRTEYTATAF